MQFPQIVKWSSVVLFAFSLLASSSAQPAPKDQTSRHVVARSQLTSTTVSTHERFITFLADKQFKSQLLLQNLRLDTSMTAKPAFITSRGEIPLNPVTLPPHSSATVDLTSMLRMSDGEKQGLIVVRYDADSYGAISAVIQSSDEKHNLYLNSVGWSREEFWYGTALDAVIWAPGEGTQGFISVVNTSAEPRTVKATFIVAGRSEQLPDINIAPRQAQLVAIDGLVARSRANGAGIHLAFAGTPGDITAEGTLLNKETGFTKYIRFADTALKFTNASLRTNFLLVGPQPAEDGFPAQISFHSVAAIRNIDLAPVQVTPIVSFLRGGSVQTITLKAVSLDLQASALIDFNQLQKAGELPQDFTQGTLELLPDTKHNSIVAELFNFNEATRSYVVGSSFSAHPARATGSIWRTDGTFQTTIVVQNTATHGDDVSLKLFSGTDSYTKTFPIPAGGLIKINLKQLQESAIPDNDGHVITGTSGTFSLAGKNGAASRLVFDKLIHSADASEYVGLLANPCVFVTGIALVLYDTTDPYVFDAFLDAFWTDGTITENETFPGTSNPALASVDGSLVTIHPFDGSSHTVNLEVSNVLLTSCDICSYDDFFAVASLLVPPMPSCSTATISVFGVVTQIPLESDFPAEKTGIGGVATMLVSPLPVVWNGTRITESVSLFDSTCPPTGLNICSGSDTFTVGNGIINFGVIFPPNINVFYDLHEIGLPTSLLDTSGTNQTSCQIVCTQSYSCGGAVIGRFFITRNFSKDTIQGTPVTRVKVDKQSQ